MSIWVNDNYYTENPQNVLGTPYESTGRYGKMIRYRGDVAVAIEKMTIGTKEYPTISLGQHREDSNADESTIMRDLLKKSEQELFEKAKNKRQKRQRELNADEEEEIDVMSFDEVDALYNAHLSTEEKEAFVYHQRYNLGRKMEGGWRKYHVNSVKKSWIESGAVVFDGEKYIPSFIFFSGNIYDKYDAIRNKKELIVAEIGEELYERQLEIATKTLQESQKNWLLLDADDESKRLSILPSDRIAQEFKIKSLLGEDKFKGKKDGRKATLGQVDFRKSHDEGWDTFESLTLREAWLYWIRKTSEERKLQIKGGLTWRDVYDLAVQQRRRKDEEDPVIFRKKKAKAKQEAARLFAIFLKDALLEEDRRAIEIYWNKTFNTDVPMDYNKVPIGFSVARHYAGAPMDIRQEKREAIAAAMITGSLCLAYGVGLGKTWSAIFIMAQFLENGWCTRPLLAVPLQVYPQFVRELKGILPQYNVLGLFNLSTEYLERVQEIEETETDKKVKTKEVPSGTITAITYQGYKQLGLSTDVDGDVAAIIWRVLDQDQDKSFRDFERQKERVQGFLGNVMAGTKVNLDELGIDFLCIDEAHSAKKVVSQVKAEQTEESKGRREYEISAGEPSAMGRKTFAHCQYIQSLGNTGNTLLLTATPFTNSPLEVYSMLAMVAYNELKNKGFDSIKNFFDKFVDVESQIVISADLQPVQKEVFVGFRNLAGLHKLIRKYFLYKKDAANLRRPNKYVLPLSDDPKFGNVGTHLPLSEAQAAIMAMLKAYAGGTEEFALGDESIRLGPKDEESGVRMLKSVSMSRSLALSPYIFLSQKNISPSSFGLPELSYKTYVEESPKLLYAMRCVASVKKWHEKNKTPVSGQILYMNFGLEYFHFIKEYLVREVGFEPYEVGIIEGSMPELEDKAVVQNKFLGRKFNRKTSEYEPIPDKHRIKVLIGSSSITEGINLQNHCTVIYNLFLPWNPTDTIQLEGRGWRQGNYYENIRIVYPLMQDSIDIFMFQKLEEKTKRINALWDFDRNQSALDLREFDPAELKYVLIKNPQTIAKLELQEKSPILQDQAAQLVIEKEILESFSKDLSDVRRFFADYQPGQTTSAKESIKDQIEAIVPDELASIGNVIDATFDRQVSQDQAIKFKEKVLQDFLKILQAYPEDPSLKGMLSWLRQLKNFQTSFTKNNNFLKSTYLNFWRLDSHIKRVQSLDAIYQKQVLTRGVVLNENFETSMKEAIAQVAKDHEKTKAEIEVLNSKEWLEQRTEEIAEQQRSKESETSLEEKIKEFASMNDLLKDRRLEPNSGCDFYQKGSRATKYAAGAKTAVWLDEETKKKAEVLEVIERRDCEPMYLMSYAGGYTNIFFESDIETTPKERAVQSRLEALLDNSLARRERLKKYLS